MLGMLISFKYGGIMGVKLLSKTNEGNIIKLKGAFIRSNICC